MATSEKVVEEARFDSGVVARVWSDGVNSWKWILLGRWNGREGKMLDFGVERSRPEAWESVEEAERSMRVRNEVSAMPTKEQREIIGPAVDLRQAMKQAEAQWRGSHPVLAEGVAMARTALLLLVNAQLMQLGAPPLKEME